MASTVAAEVQKHAETRPDAAPSSRRHQPLSGIPDLDDPPPLRALLRTFAGEWRIDALEFHASRDALGVVPSKDEPYGAIFSAVDSEFRFTWTDRAPIDAASPTRESNPTLRLEFQASEDCTFDVLACELPLVVGLRARKGARPRSLALSLQKHATEMFARRRDAPRDPDAPPWRCPTIPFALRLGRSSPAGALRLLSAAVEFESPEPTAGRLVARREFNPHGGGDLRVRLEGVRSDVAQDGFVKLRHGAAIHTEFDLVGPPCRRVLLIGEFRAARVATAKAGAQTQCRIDINGAAFVDSYDPAQFGFASEVFDITDFVRTGVNTLKLTSLFGACELQVRSLMILRDV